MTEVETMRLAKTKSIAKSGLMLGTALAAFIGGAVGQQRQSEPRQSISFNQSWDVDLNYTYSDNFRRLPGALPRFDTYSLLNDEGEVVGDALVVSERTAIEPLDNQIVSASLTGSALYQRPSMTAYVSGSVRVGSYLDTDSVNQRLLDEASFEPTDNILGFPYERSSFGVGDTDDFFIRPDIAGTASARIVDNLFYVDVSGVAQEQSVGRTTQTANEGVGQNSERVILAGASVSPYLNRQFANESTVELRYRASIVEVVDESFDESQTDTGFDADGDVQITNDSFSSEIIAEYSSGALLEQLEFNIGAYGRRVEEDGSDVRGPVDFDQGSASADVKFEVHDAFSLIGGIGYDDVQVENDGSILGPNEDLQTIQLSDDLTGFYWKTGFEYNPNRRASISATIGDRFGGTEIEANVSVRPTRRVNISASADRVLSTGNQDFASRSFSVQSQALSSFRSLANNQDTASNSLLQRALRFQGASFKGIQSGSFGVSAFDRYDVNVSGDFRRTNLSLSYGQSESDLGETANKRQSLGVRVSRQLSQRLNLETSARYSRSEGEFSVFDPNSVDGVSIESLDSEEQFYSLGLAYQIGKNLSATAQYYHVQVGNDEIRDENGAIIGSGTQIEFLENAVSVGARWTF